MQVRGRCGTANLAVAAPVSHCLTLASRQFVSGGRGGASMRCPVRAVDAAPAIGWGLRFLVAMRGHFGTGPGSCNGPAGNIAIRSARPWSSPMRLRP